MPRFIHLHHRGNIERNEIRREMRLDWPLIYEGLPEQPYVDGPQVPDRLVGQLR